MNRGYMVSDLLLQCSTPLASINERIMRLDVNTNLGTMTLLSIYRPTVNYSKQQKDEFNSQLEQIIKKVPTSNRLTVLNDFSGHVGKDLVHCRHITGKYGTGSLNENGQCVLELCASSELIVSNVYFAGSSCTNVTCQDTGISLTSS
ncbi:hypothetical protein Y1Q_0017622 [Alligator mississippiensis]|uniref:Uncharacterized protein n=1 Tax=Alligator mississippiensis TaxID=8496 RepID=A0A151P2Q3_ALLMI|nr:hypothetical protein Y1Q_0017622 [Alligator mississippiensis]